MAEPAVVIAITLDQHFLLLSNGAIMLRATPDDVYARMRVAKYATAELHRHIFEPWPNPKHARAATSLIRTALRVHKTKTEASNRHPYRRAQGAGPWPEPAKRRRKRLIVN